ncbi:MAG: helix-turn-helix transcriptional regulator [Clostridia bacterium]|nr:helix-turn-helix transcriptional regulator [Clostridia bacterium]
MSIGKNIAKYRKAKGFTQEELGERLGVTNQAVSKWESETYFPDIMLLPKIANELSITLDDLYSVNSMQIQQTKTRVFHMDNVHSFPKNMQSTIIDTLYNETNLLNCRTWDTLRVDKNPITKKFDKVKRDSTLCCISDSNGAAFVSDSLTLIDSNISLMNIETVFRNHEIALGLRKLADSNVRIILNCVCKGYFENDALNPESTEFLIKQIKPIDLTRDTGLQIDEILEALEKLISLHIVDITVENEETLYLLHKIKVIEAAVLMRFIDRFIHTQIGICCGDFAAQTKL